ncbi:MAG: sodium:solute symporter [Bacteroidota bacterium]|nr:sodium:solute symporter [Bacteroidota bacterium]
MFLISKWTKGNEDNDTFFLGKRSSPWYIVAYGMVGVSLSGITFLSVPGWVKTQEFYYMQMVLGFVPGYIFVAYILMPIYYKMKVYSIYEYLKDRFGYFSHKSGAFFFFLSRTLGASLRLFLVAKVLDLLFFSSFNIPFFVTSLFTIFFIWVYTHKGGIKTIIWTDTLQTTFMLLTVVICIYVIFKDLGFESISQSVEQNKLDLNFFLFDDFNDNRHFIRYFLSGMFISIAMTGLDQDMMQKNLSCKNIKEAQRNMVCFSLVLVFVNLLFLYLGSLLYEFASVNSIISDGDNLFVEIIKSEKLGVFVFITFLLGLMSAAYSSADSALTSLTTSFCVDFLEMDTKKSNKKNVLKRKKVHIFISFLLFCIILLVHYLNDDNIISTLFTLASYTYGPLLGLFFFGIFTKRNVNDHYVPLVVIVSPLLTYIISLYDVLLIRFNFGYELLIINGLITFICLFFISKPKSFLFDLE